MKKTLLSPEQAFNAMTVFLEEYYRRTEGKGELTAILGDIQINRHDGRPMDPAAWSDWLAAINRVLKGRIEAAQS
jgi:hypothetical protein